MNVSIVDSTATAVEPENQSTIHFKELYEQALKQVAAKDEELAKAKLNHKVDKEHLLEKLTEARLELGSTREMLANSEENAQERISEVVTALNEEKLKRKDLMLMSEQALEANVATSTTDVAAFKKKAAKYDDKDVVVELQGSKKRPRRFDLIRAKNIGKIRDQTFKYAMNYIPKRKRCLRTYETAVTGAVSEFRYLGDEVVVCWTALLPADYHSIVDHYFSANPAVDLSWLYRFVRCGEMNKAAFPT